MPEHGDKLAENLYFCMYPITLKSCAELAKLARAAHGYFPFLRDFSYVAEACEYTQKAAKEKFDKMGLAESKKYEGSGASALLQVFDGFEGNVRGFYTDESSCYLACFSSKKPGAGFVFKRDAANIEMMVSVLTNPQLDYVIHLGIQRSICYALKGHPSHPNISMLLHGCVAAYIRRHCPEKQFMVTNPLDSMCNIFNRNIQKSDIHRISDLSVLRKTLGIELGEHGRYIQTFRIEDLEAATYTAVSLDVLASFSKPAIPEICFPYMTWMRQHPKSMLGAMGFLISAGIVARLYPNEVFESMRVAAQVMRLHSFSFFRSGQTIDNEADVSDILKP